ncbi:MAG: aspartate-semialdehyde dehydrogenase [Deltaproteobacteria bacterium RIFCSPHIGHO2_12_FULL_43_9]|nr:MAG: aspartate-semialdehyde dehydrogenase [Deltaproteobacteria bacterium RIFCSPHIGHO2_12_FULL_43_9]
MVTKNIKLDVAVVGATGLVGQEMLSILEERKFPVKNLYPFASEISAGEKVKFNGEEVTILPLNKKNIESTSVDIALWSIGSELSLEYIPVAIKAKWINIDNSAAFRMEKDVPLIVPEVNGDKLNSVKRGMVIANPNCSTIQLVQILKPLHDQYGLKRVVVATYQSVSGAGKLAMKELEEQTVNLLNGRSISKQVFPHQIAFTILPHIDDFLDNLYTKEEMKVINESRKILALPDLKITSTCARVPVFYSHSEAVNIEFRKSCSLKDVRSLLSHTEGVKIADDPKRFVYPLNVEATGKNETYVGRIRLDESVESGINLWIVSDNLRKGAALNAVQIAELICNKL